MAAHECLNSKYLFLYSFMNVLKALLYFLLENGVYLELKVKLSGHGGICTKFLVKPYNNVYTYTYACNK